VLFLTADEHHGHDAIRRLCGRPFADVREQTETIMGRHNATVTEADTVVHVGDFTWNPSAIPGLLGRMAGRHVLVAGNHDKCGANHRRRERWIGRYSGYGFAAVVDSILWRGPRGERGLVYHLPPSDYADARYKELRPDPATYDFLLCGHCHEKWCTLGKAVNVGVDQWRFAPVPASVALGMLDPARALGLAAALERAVDDLLR
jgi:calcineurin-like phosphoesterase family protein